MSSSLRSHQEEIEYVAGAISTTHKLLDLLDEQERWTTAMRNEVREQAAALVGYLLVAKLEHTGDAEGVGNTMHDVLEDTFSALAA
jgi:hypothetical protein